MSWTKSLILSFSLGIIIICSIQALVYLRIVDPSIWSLLSMQVGWFTPLGWIGIILACLNIMLIALRYVLSARKNIKTSRD